MCMDPVSATLAIVGGLFSYKQQKTAAQSQANYYQAQAKTDEANAKIVQRQNEQTADNYADEQRKLTSRLRIVRGEAAATQGALGIDGASGSALDILSGSYEAYKQDSLSLLNNQRNDIYGGQLDVYNLHESAKANKAAASAVKKQAKMAGISTILGAATSLYGLSGGMKLNSSKGPSLGSGSSSSATGAKKAASSGF